jgi:peptidoglycan/LPS O-acetylase OafA/YrhL
MADLSWTYRAGAALAFATALLISWMNLAVGIAGAEDNPINMSFFMLIAVAAVGAFAAEFRARGLARTMFSVAAIQIMLGAIVATGPVAAHEPSGPMGLLALNGVFALLWLVCGALFIKASIGASRAPDSAS